MSASIPQAENGLSVLHHFEHRIEIVLRVVQEREIQHGPPLVLEHEVVGQGRGLDAQAPGAGPEGLAWVLFVIRRITEHKHFLEVGKHRLHEGVIGLGRLPQKGSSQRRIPEPGNLLRQGQRLGQWLLQQRMKKLLVVKGQHPADDQYVDSIQRMAKRFKIDIVEEKLWTGDFDLRRVAYKEVPQFTKARSAYDALFVSDHQRDFGYALPFNVYSQAPVIGDFGLKAVTWHHTIEQWGARQLQNRFVETYHRNMTSLDFTAYLAVRAIGYAAQIHQVFDARSLSETMLSEKFALAAYKGRKLSFRPQNRQLRMPIALAHDAGLLTNAPLEGFLHPTTDLDTLGYDHHERCQ